jgi:DNA-binding response OmpR family regulator
MPEVNGIEASRLITRNFPGMKVVVVSVNDDPAIIEAVFEAGASGYVLKSAAYTDLVPAIPVHYVGRFTVRLLGVAPSPCTNLHQGNRGVFLGLPTGRKPDTLSPHRSA